MFYLLNKELFKVVDEKIEAGYDRKFFFADSLIDEKNKDINKYPFISIRNFDNKSAYENPSENTTLNCKVTTTANGFNKILISNSYFDTDRGFRKDNDVFAIAIPYKGILDKTESKYIQFLKATTVVGGKFKFNDVGFYKSVFVLCRLNTTAIAQKLSEDPSFNMISFDISSHIDAIDKKTNEPMEGKNVRYTSTINIPLTINADKKENSDDVFYNISVENDNPKFGIEFSSEIIDSSEVEPHIPGERRQCFDIYTPSENTYGSKNTKTNSYKFTCESFKFDDDMTSFSNGIRSNKKQGKKNKGKK